MLKMLSYTSDAQPGIDADELERIVRSAMTLNPLDGVTGLLVFNGTAFVQIVEGAPDAIDDLAARLKADVRHVNFQIRDERLVEARSFPDWSMNMVRVSVGRFEARDDVERALPADVSPAARALVLDMVELISS